MNLLRTLTVLTFGCAAAPGQQYTISTFAGGGHLPISNNAAQASIGGVYAVAADRAGNIYFSINYAVMKLSPNGVFAVYDLGFVARCSLEDDDAGEVRLTKIQRIIEECRYGINDLSTVTLDSTTGLPRFNMPLELGLFLGCKRFGAKNQSNKRTLILDSEQYRYRQFISDISGQDIRAHGGDPERAIRAVRDWLQATSKRQGLAGGGEIIEHYRRFQAGLPAICREAELETKRLTFIDLSTVVADWLRVNR